MSQPFINFQEFQEDYKAGSIIVLVNKTKAGDFVMSKFASKYNKPAHIFWTWLGIIMTFPLPIILLIFKTWVHAIGILIIGLMINNSAKKSAQDFVLQNMLENEDFWKYVLLHEGAVLKDVDGNDITTEFLEKIQNKN